MSSSECFRTLQRANPRARDDFLESVAAVGEIVRGQIGSTAPDVPVTRDRHTRTVRPGRRLTGISAAGVMLAGAVAVAVLLTVGSPAGGPGVESAAAAVRQAVAVTAASAERSGTAVVRITHDGEIWAGATIRWHRSDIAVSRDTRGRPTRAGSELLVVDGMMYGLDERGRGWMELGPPESVDPDSGTTPGEYLAAVREDVGGVTLQRIVAGLAGLTTAQLDDGSTVYRGTVAAGLVARESGFKEGQATRVLPFGYVAHGEAADPVARLDAAITVGADGVVREIAVTWGTPSSPAWSYTVTYGDLGATPPPSAPESAQPLER